MPKKISKPDLATSLRALREAEHDSAVIDEVRTHVGNCLSMLASGLHDDALAYAGAAVEAAKELRTEAAQEAVMVTLFKLDDLLVANGVVQSFEDAVCTMPGAEA